MRAGRRQKAIASTPPVSAEETIELLRFMAAAEESKKLQQLKEVKSEEIRKQLEAKKAELLAIQKESEELLKKQQEEELKTSQ